MTALETLVIKTILPAPLLISPTVDGTHLAESEWENLLLDDYFQLELYFENELVH